MILKEVVDSAAIVPPRNVLASERHVLGRTTAHRVGLQQGFTRNPVPVQLAIRLLHPFPIPVIGVADPRRTFPHMLGRRPAERRRLT